MARDDPALIITPDERATDVLLLKSDVYETPSGWNWVVRHMRSDWSASGTSSTADGAYIDIQQVVVAAIEKAGDTVDVSRNVTLIRPHVYDHETGEER